MIHYDLVCDQDHDFDGWFRSGEDFDVQARRGFVACPTCGSTRVARALMAPNVQMSRARASAPEAPAVPEPSPAAPMVAPDPRQAAMIETLREIRARIMAEADYVGPRFAEEARRIHYGETEKRGIWGEADAREVSELIDEGIECHPVPVLPGDRN